MTILPAASISPDAGVPPGVDAGTDVSRKSRREGRRTPGWSYRRWACAHLGGHPFLVLLNLWVAVPRPHDFDPMCYYAWAQSVLADGDIDPGNQLAGNPNYPVIQFNGRPVVNDKCGIGWSLV